MFSLEKFEDFARNVLEHSSMRQINQNSINILYNPSGRLTNRKNRYNFMQSYWLVLQFVPAMRNKPDWIFTVVCPRHPME